MRIKQQEQMKKSEDIEVKTQVENNLLFDLRCEIAEKDRKIAELYNLIGELTAFIR